MKPDPTGSKVRVLEADCCLNLVAACLPPLLADTTNPAPFAFCRNTLLPFKLLGNSSMQQNMSHLPVQQHLIVSLPPLRRVSKV